MNDLNAQLLVLATLIILALAITAAYYHIKATRHVAEQTALQEEERQKAQANIDKRNGELIADIRFIAQSMVQDQCEITEGVIRIHKLSDALDTNIMKQSQFEVIRRHFLSTKDMPILDAYQALEKRARFKLDQQRFQLEAQNKDQVLVEDKDLIDYSFDSLKMLY